MKLLRTSKMDEIIGILDRSIFTSHAFDTKFNDEKRGEIIRIGFRENVSYFFIVTERKTEPRWDVFEAPGVDFINGEHVKCQTYDDCVRRIVAWIDRILEEYIVGGEEELTKYEQMRENLQEKADELPNPDLPFEPKEAAEWIARLDGLVEQFEKFEEDKKIQERELNNLKKEVESLKDRIEDMPKKLWVLSAGNKILNVLQKLSDSKLVDKLLKAGTLAYLITKAGQN